MSAASSFRRRPRTFLAALALGVLLAAPSVIPADAVAQNNPLRGTGLPLPRFVSLKSDDVNVRRGPGQDYAVAFTFVKAGLPVEITQEFDTWRKIRDSEGSEGWVYHSLLSGKRTALVAPWQTQSGGEPLAAHMRADAASPVVAYLSPRVLAEVEECRDGWCRVGGRGYRGWIEQTLLWGVYPNEQFNE